MVQHLTSGVLDFESLGDTAYRILESRNLNDFILEMTTYELENFFDRNFYLFDEETPKHEIAELAIDILEPYHFQILMQEHSDKTVYQMLVSEGFVNVVEDVTVLSIECPLLN